MKIDLQQLNYKKEIIIDEYFDFKQTYSSIKKINNAHFDGKIYIDTSEQTKIEGTLKADLILYDSVDLSDFEQKIEVNIEQILNLNEKTLDINEILWENIVLEVPIRSTRHEINSMSGEGWEIKSEDSMDNYINPELAKLQELFKGGE